MQPDSYKSLFESPLAESHYSDNEVKIIKKFLLDVLEKSIVVPKNTNPKVSEEDVYNYFMDKIHINWILDQLKKVNLKDLSDKIVKLKLINPDKSKL